MPFLHNLGLANQHLFQQLQSWYTLITVTLQFAVLMSNFPFSFIYLICDYTQIIIRLANCVANERKILVTNHHHWACFCSKKTTPICYVLTIFSWLSTLLFWSWFDKACKVCKHFQANWWQNFVGKNTNSIQKLKMEIYPRYFQCSKWLFV